MIRCIRLLTILFVAWSIPSSLAVHLSSATSAYKLPVSPSQPIFVTQGQNEGDHQAENGSQWALDIATARSRPFVVVAARSGTVIGLRSDSTVQCRSLDTRIDGTPLPGCWTFANFVLIGHVDDDMANLYLHLQNKSIMVNVGQLVEQGQPLATAGTTGYSSDIHLHFQVEAMPCVSTDAATVASCQAKAGWWWTQSKPVSFSDADVLKKNPDGVPSSMHSPNAAFNPYISDNAWSQTAPPNSELASARFPIVEDGKWGYIDGTGKVVITPQFELPSFKYMGFQGSQFTEGLAPVPIGQQWGYIDPSGHVAITPRFEYATNFADGLAMVMVNDKWGYINKASRFVIKPQFTADVSINYGGGDSAQGFSEGLAAVRPNDMWGYINTAGHYAIAPQFYSASGFSEGLASVSLTEGAPQGYINKAGRLVTKTQFLNAFDFASGLALVNKAPDYKINYIDRAGRVVIKTRLDIQGASSFSEGLASVSSGYIDTTGKLVIRANYDSLGDFSGGMAAVYRNSRSGKAPQASCGYIYRSGKLTIPLRYNNCVAFTHGLALVQADGRWGYIDRSGAYVWRQSSRQPLLKALTVYVDAAPHGALGAHLYTRPNTQSATKMLIPDQATVSVAPDKYTGQPDAVLGPNYAPLTDATGSDWFAVTYKGQSGYVRGVLLSRYFPGAISPDVVLSLRGIEQRTTAAYERYGTYRFRTVDLANNRQLLKTGDVNIKQGVRDLNPDGSIQSYAIGRYEYIQLNGVWTPWDQREPYYDSLYYTIENYFTGKVATPAAPWLVKGFDVINGKRMYVLGQDNPHVATTAGGQPVASSERLWIDAVTFLPLKETYKSGTTNAETDYVDWGAPITVQLPPSIVTALTPRPTDPQLTLYVAANGYGLDLHTQPDDKSSVIVHVPDGATVLADRHPIDTHDQNLWYKATYNGQTGYLLAWYVRLASSGVPPQPSPTPSPSSSYSQPASPSSYTWTATGLMSIARAGHTATLLSNGRVLVGGGTNSTSTELYDPSSGTWTLSGNMTVARLEHTATLLQDGRVLVAGGCVGSCAGNGATASAELYDPTSGMWTATGSMNDSRYQHTATLLSNGQVLVVGGVDSSGSALATAELYDPTTGTWTPTGSMTTARTQHTATLLPDGKVLVTGGIDNQRTMLASAELYDPTTGTWAATGSMAIARSEQTATLLRTGQVLVAGGADSTVTELYDPATGTWTATGSMAVSHVLHTATLLPDGTVVVAGGSYRVTAELYDPRSGTWSTIAAMTAIRSGGHTATLLPNGTLLVAGGDYCNGGCGELDSAEVLRAS